MRQMRVAIATGLLTVLPALGFAQPSSGQSPPVRATSSDAPIDRGTQARSMKTAIVTVHATRGIVKFVDAGNLVITRSRHRPDMKFAVNPATECYGDVKVGSTVDVRYRTEAQQRIATAVTVEHAKQSPSAPESHQD